MDSALHLLRFHDAVVALVPLDHAHDPDLLAPAERGLLDSAPSEHRARELLAGRTAARHALFAADPARPRAAVLHDEKGRPRLEPPGDDAISLAHDGRFAAAAVAPRAVGIDLCDLGRLERVRTVVELRLSKGLANPFTGPTDVLPCPVPVALWTAWEAAGKRTGGGVLAGPMRWTWTLGTFEGGPSATAEDVRIRWFLHEGHVVALATALDR